MKNNTYREITDYLEVMKINRLDGVPQDKNIQIRLWEYYILILMAALRMAVGNEAEYYVNEIVEKFENET